MYTFIHDPRNLVKAGFLAVLTLLITAAAVGAQPFTSNPGTPAESGVSAELWAQIDAGSLATIHRGQPTDPTDQVLAVVYNTTEPGIEWTYDIGEAVEGWFRAVAEAGAIGGIPS